MSEAEYADKKKSKLKSSRRTKKAKDSSDEASPSLPPTPHPLSISVQAVRDYRDDRLKEAATRRELLAEHLQIEESQAAEGDDAAALAALEPPAAEARALRERPYSGASAQEGFRGLERWARELNLPVASCPEPEIVLVGPAGEGKTSVLSALLGVPVSAAGATLRPFVYHVTGGADAAGIRRDAFLAEFAREQRLENGSISLPAEIDRRNKSTEEPVDIDIALPGHVRMTLVDTPGFVLDPDAEGAALAEAALKAAIAPSNRLIVVVRRALDVSAAPAPCGDYLMDLVRQADPTLARTVAVYTHLSTYLQSSAAAQNPKAAARFLSGASILAGSSNAAGGSSGVESQAGASATTATTSSAPLSGNSLSEGRIFFATFPPAAGKSASSGAEFSAEVYRYAMRDVRSVEGLQCDTQAIGAHNLARCVFGYAWRVHQASAPRVLAALRARRASHAGRLAAVRGQRERLASPAVFRVRAAAYTAAFLRSLRALVAGSACGNPALSGQTSAEELAAAARGAWADADGRPLPVRYADWGVPNWQSKVYGGQQLERLLAEFSALCAHVSGDVISDDDVITALGTPALGSSGSSGGRCGYRGRAEAACALACRRAEAALAPLIAQLCERATYVMKRLAPIAARMVAESSSAEEKKLAEDGRFVHFVCEKYAALVDAESERCAELCAREFHSVGAVCFAMVEEKGESEEGESEEDKEDDDDVAAVRRMEERVFGKIRERVVRNVVLRVYNGLVVPMEGELWARLQREVSELEDETVEGLFEATRMKAELEKVEEAIEKELKEMDGQEKDILKLSAAFCHPKN